MARRKALVTQHLENVSGDLLTSWQALIARHTKRRQGIYALYRKRKLYYVGLASNLAGRLNSHRRDRHKGLWDRFSVYLTIGDEHMRELEALLLRIIQPSGNKVKGKFAQSENLLPILRQEYRTETRRMELLLRIIQPTGNKVKGKFAQSENLLPVLRREYRTETRRMGAGSSEAGLKLKPAKAGKKSTRKSKATGRRPMLAPYVDSAFNLKARVKGTTYRARVRQDGTIGFRGKVYNSPSLAGKAAVGHGTNGWVFWKYERSPGDWVLLDQLRKSGAQKSTG